MSIARIRTMPPGPREHPLLGSIAELRKDPLNFYNKLFRQYGDVCSYHLFRLPRYLISHPDGVQRVFQGRNKKEAIYNRDFIEANIIKQFVGKQGLLVSDGDFWLQRRRLMNPAFDQKHIHTYSSVFIQNTRRLLAHWASYTDQKTSFDVEKEMSLLSLRNVCHVIFSTDLEAEEDGIVQGTAAINKYLAGLGASLLPLPLSIPVPSNRRVRKLIDLLDQAIYRFIAERRQQREDENHHDLLTLLLQAHDENDQSLSERQIRNEIASVLMAGQDTTATALTWTVYLLSLHPEVEQRLWTEIDTVLAGRQLEAEDLPHLPYARQIILEALRWYPPAFGAFRTVQADDEIGGYYIPKGAEVTISYSILHHRPDQWEEPERFYPDHFTPECVEKRHRFAFLPFGAGSHRCIGMDVALTEAHIALVMIAQRYRLQLSPGHPPVEPCMEGVLHPRGGLHMHVKTRRDA